MAAKVLTMQVAMRPANESRLAGFYFDILLFTKIHNAMKISNSTEIESSIRTALYEVQCATLSVPQFSEEEMKLLKIFRTLYTALYDFILYFGEEGARQ